METPDPCIMSRREHWVKKSEVAFIFVNVRGTVLIITYVIVDLVAETFENNVFFSFCLLILRGVGRDLAVYFIFDYFEPQCRYALYFPLRL